MSPPRLPDEAQAVRARYARRAPVATGVDRYAYLQPDVWHSVQQRQRVMLRLFTNLGWTTLANKTALEVGCGAGGNLLELLRLGFAPQHLTGIELLAERHAVARHVLPAALALHLGDALDLPDAVPEASQQLVLQSTVFSSLLDDAYQQRLAAAMWRWTAPGGGVLWYDFTVDNPRNADVRGMPLTRVRALFPQARVRAWRLTLAPPLARAACRLHPHLYPVLNTLPWLRTHVLAWLEKPLS